VSVRRALALVVALGIGVAGCDAPGERDAPQSSTTTTTTAPAPEPPHETVDRLGELPQGFRPFVERRGGFAVAIPRGWKAERRGSNALIRSYDRLVALAITPNRSRHAQDVPLDEFAARTAKALTGFREPVHPSRPHPFEHRYPAVQVRDEATERKSGVRERLRVIVLRRKDLVTFTAIVAANAERHSEPAEDLALKVLHTLRSRPPRNH
jgi:hypothetical protein